VTIDVLASEPHFVDHLSAVFGSLPEEARGAFLAPLGPVSARVKSRGFAPVNRSEVDRPTLVASFGDLGRAFGLGRTRIAIMEHGAGQSYGGRNASATHGSYAGGKGRDPASLFLHPGPHPADRDRKAYPSARVEVVGAPILDTLPKREGEKGRVVAVSFHFNGFVAPETKNALQWALPSIVDLAKRYQLIGHAHPRLFHKLERLYRTAGIEPVADFDEVCRRADVYVCDNSSTIFAFASTGRPVVLMNPPWYDRRVNHGLRFWDAADVGIQCDEPRKLGDAIEEALKDKPAQRKRREAALDKVYAYRTGAADRAADVLLDWAA